jgi:acyl carrier protein|tara:strand:- start:615 stop:851 length:237 start_codon:yes stop_codon:yes gene_type:complete
MENLKKYDESFIKTFAIKKKELSNLEYNKIESWDSIGHMTLISELEESFKISIETDDIIDFSSYQKGKEILKKYKIKF